MEFIRERRGFQAAKAPKGRMRSNRRGTERAPNCRSQGRRPLAGSAILIISTAKTFPCQSRRWCGFKI